MTQSNGERDATAVAASVYGADAAAAAATSPPVAPSWMPPPANARGPEEDKHMASAYGDMWGSSDDDDEFDQ
jgi:hypothetical protein